jgi:hypothetical protein
LRRTPRSQPAPDLPYGWFTWLVLEEPAAIQLSEIHDYRRSMAGIFDAQNGSLAVVEGQRILSFGGDAAMLRLREKLSRLRPVDLRALLVEAVPSDQPVQGKDGWVLHRPGFQFVIHEGTREGTRARQPTSAPERYPSANHR